VFSVAEMVRILWDYHDLWKWYCRARFSARGARLPRAGTATGM